MSWRLFGALVVVSIWASVVGVQAAVGAPLSEPFEVLLGYEASYSRGGGSVVHRGVDLSASEGDSVSSPLSGRVSFAGRVPSPGGGSRNVVTIEFGDGLRATFLPLERIAVKTGQQVSLGEIIGAVAVVAGESTPMPHLHVSVRRGNTYIDPMPFLPVQTATIVQPGYIPQEAPAPVVITAPQASPQPISAPVPQPISAPVPQPISAPVPQPISAPVPQPVLQTVIQASPRTVSPGSTDGFQGAEMLKSLEGLQVTSALVLEPLAQLQPGSWMPVTGDQIVQGSPLVDATEERSMGPATAPAPGWILQSEAGLQGPAGGSEALGKTFNESAQLPISAVGVAIVAIAALFGLVPIVRGREETSTEDSSISTREQFAAAVSR